MALSIGELVGYIKVDDTEFNKGVDRADRRFGGVAAGMAKVAKVTGAAIVAGVGYSLVKGFGRLTAIENAQAKLKALGHDAGSVDKIMENALASVKGTAFGLDEAATVAASAVAAGIKPGKQLEGVLGVVGDAAAIAGVSMGEMGSIFNKVAAKNKLQAQEVNQLTERGIPILGMLADQYGVTQAEVSDMVSKGQVDFKAFRKAMEANVGGAAVEMGNTTTGAFKNMGAAAGRMGAAMLAGVFPVLIDGFKDVTAWLDVATAAVEPLAASFGNWLGAVVIPLVKDMAGVFASAIGAVISAIVAVVGFMQDHETTTKILAGVIMAVLVPALIVLGVQHTIAAARAVAAWLVQKAAALGYSVAFLAVSALMVANWIRMGAVAMAQALRMAASWVIAMGPVGWVIAVIVGLVILIAANWDKIRKATVKAWAAVVKAVRKAWEEAKKAVAKAVAAVVSTVTKAWTRVRTSTTKGLDNVIGFVRKLPSRIRGALSSLGSTVRTLFSNAMTRGLDAVRNLGSRIRDWIAGIPGKLLSLGSRFGSAGRSILQSFIDGMKNAAGIIAGIAGNVWNTVRGLLNGAITRINRALEFRIKLPAGRSININPPDIPHLATGGRATGATLAVIGEGREPESVLPDSVLRGLLERAHAAGAASRDNGGGRNAPLIGQVVQAPGESADLLAERLWFKTRTRG
jgi:tape measure domain-containing protein